MKRQLQVRQDTQLVLGRQLGLAVGTLVWLGAMLAQASVIQTPIALTPGSFNENMVGGTGAGITATMDQGTILGAGQYTYYTVGYNGGAPATGIPMGTTFTSQHDLNTTYALQPISAANNAVLLAGGGRGPISATLTLATPAAYTHLSFLGASGDPLLSYTINFANAAPPQTGPLFLNNWFDGGGPIAYASSGRVDFLNNFQTFGGPPYLFQIDLPVTDHFDPISSISLSLSGDSNNRTAIFALSGELVPEPSTILLLALGGLTLRGWYRRGQRRGEDFDR